MNDRRLGGPQSRSVPGDEGEKFPAPAQTRTPDHPARSSSLCKGSNKYVETLHI